MKGLKKIALVSAIAAASTVAQAELKAMNDSAMSAATGQAGITIDINSAAISIGEIQYKDAGSIFINDFQLGGAGILSASTNAAIAGKSTLFDNTLDNLKIIIDVVGSSDESAINSGAAGSINWGLNKIDTSVVALTGQSSTVDSSGVRTEVAVTAGDAGSLSAYSLATTVDPVINDGDLVIGLDGINQDEAVDLGIVIGGVVLGKEAEVAGNGRALQAALTNTVLLADTYLGGGIGPIDIVIDGENGGMNINAYFALAGEISLPFIATKFGFALHNKRGRDFLYAMSSTDNSGGAQVYTSSGAHAQILVEAASDTAKGLHVVVQDFSGDMDFTDITFGSAPSIGDVYITDLSVQADMNIYGH